MEVVDPMLRPKLRHTPVETDSVTVAVGGSCYRALYTSKLSIACSRKHSKVLSANISKYIPEISNSPGFVLQKFNESGEDECGARGGPSTLGTPTKVAQSSQSIPLSVGMAKALFDPKYVDALKEFLDAEAGVAMGSSVLEERHAEKPAVYFKPPANDARRGKKRGRVVDEKLGKLAVSTVFSNYNLVRNKFSGNENPFSDDDGPQLLGQITMRDTAANPNSAPLLHFSAPAAEILAFMQDAGVRNLIRLYTEARPQPPEAAGNATSDSDD